MISIDRTSRRRIPIEAQIRPGMIISIEDARKYSDEEIREILGIGVEWVEIDGVRVDDVCD